MGAGCQRSRAPNGVVVLISISKYKAVAALPKKAAQAAILTECTAAATARGNLYEQGVARNATWNEERRGQ
eukprot:1161808-Pelagomonas_calceolata.AAC.2